MRWLASVLLAIVLSACVPPPVDPTSSVVSVGALKSDGTAGTSNVRVAFPCQLGNLFWPTALMVDTPIMIDGTKAAGITPCQYRDITVPAGKHAIQLYGSLFGNGEVYVLPAGQTLNFIPVPIGHNLYQLREVTAAQHAAAVANIDKDTKKANTSEAPAAPSPPDHAERRAAAENARGGPSRVQIVWPCLDSAFAASFRSNGWLSRWHVLIDEKDTGATVAECGHTVVETASGSRGIRIANPTLDLRGLFGAPPPRFDVPAGGTTYLRVRRDGDINVSLFEIYGARAAAEVTAVDQEASKTASATNK